MRAPHLIRTLATVAIGALIAVGCGSDEESGSDSDSSKSGSTKDEQVEVREPTEPERSADMEGDLGDEAAALTEAGCTFGTFEEEEPEHVNGEDELDFGTFPPTSGTHFPDWAPFGWYDERVGDGYVVHNLEHGGVAVWIGNDVPDDVSEAVEGLLDDGEKWIVSPRADLDGLYSAAWGKGLSCPPAALEQLGAEGVAAALDAWYSVVESTGSEAEKDVPAYAGAMKEPAPTKDISIEAPF